MANKKTGDLVTPDAPTTKRIKLTRIPATTGGFGDINRTEYKVSEWPIDSPLPHGAVRVAEDSPLSADWRQGSGPDEVSAADAPAPAPSPVPDEVKG